MIIPQYNEVAIFTDSNPDHHVLAMAQENHLVPESPFPHPQIGNNNTYLTWLK